MQYSDVDVLSARCMPCVPNAEADWAHMAVLTVQCIAYPECSDQTF